MGEINKDEFRKLIKCIDFKLENGSGEVYSKTYVEHDNYKIYVDFDNEKIDYESGKTAKQSIEMRGKNLDGTPVKATRKTTSNFHQSENMIVLECVDRLLKKGYEPNAIILEKSWPAGLGISKYLDILVQKDNKAYFMIDCKFGKEYEKEKKRMARLKDDGQPAGQLWAYLTNEINTTKLICLYTSHFDGNEIEPINDIIEIMPEWTQLNSLERFMAWKENGSAFKNAGIFEKDFPLYNSECTQPRRLEQITAESASTIFQSFLEILRHNAISDKANAFNKILNIFICKIIDEDEPEENRKFWWDENTDTDKFMDTLENLYKRGMDNFLHISVTDYADDDIDALFTVGMSDDTKNAIRDAFRKQKTERSSEFAFREIYNRDTFIENANIVKEVVQLIQRYQFRYGHKHQFLGEFFEQLLATSIKQESGQFFTPIRIAKFICTSLPLKEETEKSLHDSSQYNLPLVVDYACGSGHFLTEYMDVEQTIINNVDRASLNRMVRNELGDANNRDDDYKWASKYVYGIEKDYRLAKTTKLNTFLNGDGDANIINADGLAPFDTFERNLALYATSKENGKFTFVIANPPYSVEDFDITMHFRSKDVFSLWNNTMGDNIECLFIERTAQLLKEGGYAAIIVPDSVSFIQEELFTRTRELLFSKFRMKAIVNLTGKCFSKTDVNTKILFLQRRSNNDARDIQELIASFVKTGKDFNYRGHNNVIQKYLSTYGEGISFEEYVNFVINDERDESVRYIKRVVDALNVQIAKDLKRLKKSKEYKNASILDRVNMEQKQIKKTTSELVLNAEINKLRYYLLTFDDEIIIADTLQKDECKRFTGLSFSERGGKQGTTTAKENYLINDENIWDDELKLNYYIRKACVADNTIQIPQVLEKHARVANASEIFEYLGLFRNTFEASVKKKIVTPLGDEFIEKKVEEIMDSLGPNTSPVYDNNYISEHQGMYPVYSAATLGEAVKGYIDTFDYDEEGIQISTDGVNAGTVTYRKKQKFSIGPANRVYYVREDFKKAINLKYVYHQLRHLISLKGYNWTTKCGKDKIESFYIQIPINSDGVIDYDKQQKIVDDLDSVDKIISNKEAYIANLDYEMMQTFESKFGNPVVNDMKWDTTHLNIDDCKNGLNFTYDEEGMTINCLTVADFKDNFLVENTDSLSKIKISKEISSDYLLKDNDIVFVRSNGNKSLVGRSVLIHTGNEPVTYSGFCIRYRNNNENLNTLFLLTLLKTLPIREKLFGRGSNITNLNQTMLSELSIIQPPRAEQDSFAQYVQSINVKKEALIKEIASLKANKVALINKYFG